MSGVEEMRGPPSRAIRLCHLRLSQQIFNPFGGTNMMRHFSRRLGPAVIAISIIAAAAVRADDTGRDEQANRYKVNVLVSDIPDLGGQVIDPNLKNAWGVAFSPAASPFWVADNGAGVSTLYD